MIPRTFDFDEVLMHYQEEGYGGSQLKEKIVEHFTELLHEGKISHHRLREIWEEIDEEFPE